MAIGQWNESVTDLIPGYRHTRAMLRRARDENEIPIGKATIGSMISDVEYALEWLETGRRPGNRRGIERRAAYQRERATDPLILQSYFRNTTGGGPSNLSDSERFKLQEAMHNLSSLERECFEMAYGQCFTHDEIATLLSLKKGTVDKVIQRANTKIQMNKMSSLFLVE